MRGIIGGGELELKGRNSFNENFFKGERKNGVRVKGKRKVKNAFFLLWNNLYFVFMLMDND